MYTTSETATFVPSGYGQTVHVLGSPITFKIRAHESGGAFTLFEGLVTAGAFVPPHLHPREDETFYVLAGEVELLMGDAWQPAITGAVVSVPRGVVHAIRNNGESDARILTMVTPGGLVEQFFEAVSQLPPPAGPEDAARVVELAHRFGTEFLPPPTP
jgi:quercetin dioxygenase-like cupin family protein